MHPQIAGECTVGARRIEVLQKKLGEEVWLVGLINPAAEVKQVGRLGVEAV